MRNWTALPALAAVALLALAAAATPALAQKPKAATKSKAAVFEACLHGCRYGTIQKAVDAAGSFKFKNPKRKAKVAVRPGKYIEGVVLDGTQRRKDFDGLTIEGTVKNNKRVILEGRNAKGELGAAQNGIEAISVDGVVLRNLWARNYRSNGFFVHAADGEGQHCVGYAMDNLLASGNRSSGLFAKNCLGGKMVDSASYHQGNSAFSVGETPCDNRGWTNHGPTPAPCQREPRWTLLKNDRGYESALGFSGTNSKYVKIIESAFFNDGVGIAPNTLDGERLEPNGWNLIERNDIFWNNFNYFLAGAGPRTASAELGEAFGAPLNFPAGVGVALLGGDGNVVRRNKVFGNDKWGIATYSGPGEPFSSNLGDDAKNINNQITENTMGREGADPNGEYDFFDDDTGGGNCWSGNSQIATFAPGNGSVPLRSIYPACPAAPVTSDSVSSLNTEVGLQVTFSAPSNPKTLLGYAATSPAQNQQCSWVRRVAEHPPFQDYEPIEVSANPGEVTCG